jgi:hypothetical protein
MRKRAAEREVPALDGNQGRHHPQVRGHAGRSSSTRLLRMVAEALAETTTRAEAIARLREPPNRAAVY